MNCPEEHKFRLIMFKEENDDTVYCFTRDDIMQNRKGDEWVNPASGTTLFISELFDLITTSYEKEIEHFKYLYFSDQMRVRSSRRDMQREDLIETNEKWDKFSPKSEKPKVTFGEDRERYFYKDKPPTTVGSETKGRFSVRDSRETTRSNDRFEEHTDPYSTPPRKSIGRFTISDIPTAPKKKGRYDLD